MADGNPGSRVFAYDVAIVGEDPSKRYFKSVYFSSVGCGVGYEMDEGCTRLEVPKSKLPAGKTLRIAVRPISSLDTKGRAIGTVWPTAPKTVRPRWS